jgi:hypothetical protein
MPSTSRSATDGLRRGGRGPGDSGDSYDREEQGVPLRFGKAVHAVIETLVGEAVATRSIGASLDGQGNRALGTGVGEGELKIGL